MSRETLTNNPILKFISAGFVPALCSIIVFFLYQMATGIEAMKDNLQQVLIKQSTVEERVSNLESKVTDNTERLNKKDEAERMFYQTYELKRK